MKEKAKIPYQCRPLRGGVGTHRLPKLKLREARNRLDSLFASDIDRQIFFIESSFKSQYITKVLKLPQERILIYITFDVRFIDNHYLEQWEFFSLNPSFPAVYQYKILRDFKF